MALTAVLQMKFKADAVDEAKAVMAKALVETRAFEGCQSVEALVDTSDPTSWTFLERWESAEADAKYREFRAGPGAITELGSLLAGAPTLTFYETDPAV
jgi:quinol monooxygenase YgiN